MFNIISMNLVAIPVDQAIVIMQNKYPMRFQRSEAAPIPASTVNGRRQ